MQTKRLVLCRGQFCNLDRRADKLYRAIDPVVRQLNGDACPPPMRLVTANCLDMCQQGPNCIVQPGGKPHNHLTEATLLDIVDEILEGE